MILHDNDPVGGHLSQAKGSSLDDKIAYHEEMESLAMQAGDFTKADHHRKMQEIYRVMKEKQKEREKEKGKEEAD